MKQIIFHRQGKNVMAKIIGINVEPLGNTRQVVFFCQDSGGKRYRVPKSEVLENTLNAYFLVKRVLNNPVALAQMKLVLGSGVV